MCRIWIGILLLCVSIPSLPFAGAEDTSTQHALDQAKETYTTEMLKLHEAISDSLERRMNVARKMGNKAIADSVTLEQKKLNEQGQIPRSAPANLQRKAAVVAAGLENAYATAIRDFLKSGRDDAAAVVEKELAEFQELPTIGRSRLLLIGTWTLEMGNYVSDLTFYPNGTFFHSRENHTAPWKIDVKNKCLLLYGPGGSGNDKADKINLPLDPKMNRGVSWTGPMFTFTKKETVAAPKK